MGERTTIQILGDYKIGDSTRSEARRDLIRRGWDERAANCLIDMVDKHELLAEVPGEKT